MSINSIENTTRYTAELDKMFAQKSATGFFADSTLATKFVGAKTVIIPDVNFQGLADYDRDTGFSRGAITVSNASYTMTMDRARSLQIDREDMDETGIANLAGQILGEYVRTKVVPECDAYVLSKLAGLAQSRANTVNGDASAPLETLINLINEVQAVVGYDEELVAFIDSYVYAAMQNSGEISNMITVSDFKQGEVNLKVKSLNGVALIPVVSERMKTAYTFQNNAAGGFVPADNARSIYMLVCPKKGAHLVKKTENMRIFTPEQNIDADAYKFDYRIYYDVFVAKSGLDAVWAWVSPQVNITSQPANKSVTEGSISGSISVTANSTGTLTYQWYSCSDESGNDAVKIAGATSASMTIPTDLEAGKYFYFVKVILNGMAGINSKIATVTVA
ncbi:MAG: hypothetical protein U0L88_16135 [Acutalibacteraceae bacterium]|nr:hypothetical protein [Acutalibacteraceae bacterium]